MSQTLTIELSEPVVQQLKQIASTTQQSLEQVVRQSIEGNLPPNIPSDLPEMKGDLLRMQTASIMELRTIATSQIAQSKQQRHVTLLEKNSANNLAEDERQELEELRLSADKLMLRKAYAWALLRWRGFPLAQPN